MRRIAIRCVTHAAKVLQFVFNGVAILSLFTVGLAVLHFISEPFYTFAEWYARNNVLPKALFLVLAPLAAALASQIKGNLAEQDNRQEPRSIVRAFNQATKEQTLEMVMGWLTWLAFAAGAIALGQIVGLFHVPKCPM